MARLTVHKPSRRIVDGLKQPAAAIGSSAKIVPPCAGVLDNQTVAERDGAPGCRVVHVRDSNAA